MFKNYITLFLFFAIPYCQGEHARAALLDQGTFVHPIREYQNCPALKSPGSWFTRIEFPFDPTEFPITPGDPVDVGDWIKEDLTSESYRYSLDVTHLATGETKRLVSKVYTTRTYRVVKITNFEGFVAGGPTLGELRYKTPIICIPDFDAVTRDLTPFEVPRQNDLPPGRRPASVPSDPTSVGPGSGRAPSAHPIHIVYKFDLLLENGESVHFNGFWKTGIHTKDEADTYLKWVIHKMQGETILAIPEVSLVQRPLFLCDGEGARLLEASMHHSLLPI